MSSTAAQLQFAAESVAFLAAAAGLALVVLRAELTRRVWWAQAALATGFVALGGAAFAHGSLVVGDRHRLAIAAVRAIGIVAVAAGSWHWQASVNSQRLLWAGLALTGVAALLGAGSTQHRYLVDAALVLGGAAIGGGLLGASRRQIAARVAASAAGTLLIVVLVLSVALSAVLSNSSENEALRRLDSRARAILASAQDGARTDSLRTARFAAAYLVVDDAPHGQLLQHIKAADDAKSPLPADGYIGKDLTDLARLFQGFFGLTYATPSGQIFAADPSLPRQLAVEVVGQDLFKQTHCGSDASAIIAVGGAAFAAGSVPLCTLEANLIGVVMAVTPLDVGYLTRQVENNEALSLALFSHDHEVSHTDPGPPAVFGQRLSATVLDNATSASRVTTSQYVTALPVTSGGHPLLVLVASTPSSVVTATRDKLFRTLFLIALGGTLLALLLAALVGERIGSGLRQLTSAAERIRRGETGTRAAIESEDEVGVLGAAFDSMVESIEEKTEALKEAADDETRLRNRLEAVVAGMGDALVAVDAFGRVTDFNQAAEELSGVSARAARGRRVGEVLYIVDEDGRGLTTKLAKPSPTRWSAIASVVQPDGTNVAVAISAGALRGASHELVGNVFVIRDLRREREVERMKTEFLSRVGHELRTPLTGILGYSEILTRKDVPPERARLWQEEILHASKRLLRIVEMLEFFASSSAGRVLLRPERLDLRPVVDDLVGRWTARVDGNVTIGRRIARGTPPVDADPRWLAMSIDELIDNAVKFSPNGGKIMVTAIGADNGNGQGVEISVIDRGKGMTVEEQAAAFGEFVQGDASDTRRFGGLGLGLALVKRVVDGHGGSVTCVSRPGKGSAFTIFLPAAGATAT